MISIVLAKHIWQPIVLRDDTAGCLELRRGRALEAFYISPDHVERITAPLSIQCSRRRRRADCSSRHLLAPCPTPRTAPQAAGAHHKARRPLGPEPSDKCTVWPKLAEASLIRRRPAGSKPKSLRHSDQRPEGPCFLSCSILRSAEDGVRIARRRPLVERVRADAIRPTTSPRAHCPRRERNQPATEIRPQRYGGQQRSEPHRPRCHPVSWLAAICLAMTAIFSTLSRLRVDCSFHPS